MTRAGAYWAGGGVAAIMSLAIMGGEPIVALVAVLVSGLLISYLDRRID